MRFDRLHIPAFGPFTNLDIKFTAEGGDLQVIYGSNEAGKSSLLRAFRDLLFGIHGQSPDNFLHEYKDLRIKGEVINRVGARLIFQRRKGNKNTLLDAEGNPLPDNALAPFLGSVDQAYFSTMFGLGVRELREGAEQLLRGEGHMGDALFSASMGGTPVQKILAALTEESESLFKGRAIVNVSIRPASNKYKELLRQSRDAAVNPETWEKVEREIATAEKNKAKLENNILGLKRDLEWISRCEDALPSVGRLSEEMGKLEALPSMPDVSGDFVERVRTARQVSTEANSEVKRLKTHIANLETQLVKCQTSPSILAVADALSGLHQGLGGYRERKDHRADLEAERAGLKMTLRAGMQNLGMTGSISDLATLRLSSAERLACEEAGNTLDKALEELDKQREKTKDLQAQIKNREMQLASLPETDLVPLREALSVAAGATDANRTLSTSDSEIKRLTQETLDLYKALTGAPADMDETAGLPVPAKSTIRRISDEMDELRRQMKLEETKINENKHRIESIQAELGRIQRRGALSSEQALRNARDNRDHGWDLVLAEWKGSGAPEEFVPDIPLEEAFPQSITQADEIADQLREHAEAVAQVEEKHFQIGKSEKQIQEAEEAIRGLKGELTVSQTAWEETWQPCEIKPQTPVEMDEWREVWAEFKGSLRQLRDAEETFRNKNNQIQRAKKQLAAVLGDSEKKDFEILFESAKKQVQQGEETRGRRKEIVDQLLDLQIKLETFQGNAKQLNKACETASEEWKAQCQHIGIPDTISPTSGLALLKERTEILSKFDSWEKLSAESEKSAKAVDQYEQSANEQSTALGIEGDTIEAKVSKLWEALTRSRDAQTQYDQLAGQIEKSKSELKGIQEASKQADQTLDELTRLAKLETVEALEPLLANLEARSKAQQKIDILRDTLSGLARGQTVDDFVARIRAEDIETLSQRKGLLQSQTQEKEMEHQSLQDTLYELKNQKQTLEAAGDAAANSRQEAESYAAQLRQDASRFIRLRLAAHFLQAQIEQFRKENQGPLLKKSGQIFHQITRGAFSGLGAEFKADDTPILVGLRPDHSPVHISGMSDGARDQLFLALRLAALDQHLEQHEPMPLILDDLLVTCDNERAKAILPQLAELAQRTQIFLFTHHEHLVELCRRTLIEDSFHLHRLSAGNVQ